jgi:hypothetical protein
MASVALTTRPLLQTKLVSLPSLSMTLISGRLSVVRTTPLLKEQKMEMEILKFSIGRIQTNF